MDEWRKRLAGIKASQKPPDAGASATGDITGLLHFAVACHQAGQFSEAEKVYRKILKRFPRQPDCLNLLGVIHYQRGDCREALRFVDLALKSAPDAAVAHSNRAAALLGLKRFDEALASCNRAIALKPDCFEALNTRAAVLVELRRFDEALASADMAIALKPDYAQAYNNRGFALKELRRPVEALESYDRAIAIDPNLADAHNNRANVLNQLERFDESVPSAQRAIALKPNLAAAHLNLGTACLGLKRYAEAVSSFERVLALDPEMESLRGTYLHAKLFACDWTNLEAARARFDQALADGKLASAPYQLLACSSDPGVQLTCTEKFAARYYPFSQPLWRGKVYSHRRIRVAYLSGDFTDHPVSLLTIGLFEQHDRTRFETTAISYGRDSAAPIRQRLKGAFDRFIDARAMTAEQVAGHLRELEIDIAVDLSGFTDGSRPEVLVQRPAPVQINYLGYAGTLGHRCWDYIIADPFVIPDGSDKYFTEKVVRLPHCFMPNDSTRSIAGRSPSRAEAGLPDKGLVFCSFNNSFKITPEVFDVWMRLLARVEESVLWFSSPPASVVDNLRREAAARGVAAERLVFAPRVPRNDDHLARMRLADLFLDTFGYNAHTTAADALWMGVPVVTCAGATFAGRVAGSLLHAVGLPELVTTCARDYEALALALARDPARLALLREKLARNRGACPLFDTGRFTRDLEAAYTTMHERTQRGEPPQSFAVDALEQIRPGTREMARPGGAALERHAGAG